MHAYNFARNHMVGWECVCVCLKKKKVAALGFILGSTECTL